MDIKGVIKQRGYTLQRIADEWMSHNGKSMTKGALSMAINGNPTIGTLQSIAKVIGCTVGDFFADELDGIVRCPHCGKRFKIVPLD